MADFEDIQVPQEGYANLTNDYMFKKIFGSEECKDILITFLNHIMGDKIIEDVTFLPTEHLGPTEEDRKAVFDVSCRAAGGEEFIVEMQNAQQPYFKDRSLFYSCYPVINQAGAAKQKYHQEHGNTIGFSWDFRLHPVRFLAVLNFAIGHSPQWPEDRCHSSYHIREDNSYEMLHDKLQFIFLELGRFHKTEDQLVTPYDKWMYLFKNLPKMKSRPSVFNESEFDRLFEMSKFANFTADEFRNYQKSEKMIYDYHNTIDFAKQQGYDMGREEGRLEGRLEGREEGREEGRLEGIQKGREEGRLEGRQEGMQKGREEGRLEGRQEGMQKEKAGVAVRMHEMGMETKVICEVTGLSEDELEKILQSK